ncbi:alanine--tRNA ligase-related protein [Candidatus Dependentiae bacterium]|nr:alanine--tRNA ligase-related protein [Candidatus Dependentiae bacterium]
MTTKLLYLEDMCKLRCAAHILKIIHEDELNKIIVDQTVFYPQGGGQPSDKGIMKNNNTIFDVQSVSIEDGISFS